MIDYPKEYKQGFADFLGCRIDLSEMTFIPRIETEYWLGKVIKELEGKRGLEIMDMFSGSGCIGIAFLKLLPKACSKMVFVDIDERACKQIKKNIVLNKVDKRKCNVFCSNLFDKVKGKYNIIFANPPYVARERKKEVDAAVLRYEPKKALFSGKKGLFHIKRFLAKAPKHLKKRGLVFVEFDPDQKEDIESMLKKNKYKEFHFFKDQFKKYRWLKARFD